MSCALSTYSFEQRYVLTETDRQIDGQTDRQTDRERDRLTADRM